MSEPDEELLEFERKFNEELSRAAADEAKSKQELLNLNQESSSIEKALTSLSEQLGTIKSIYEVNSLSY